MGVWNILPKLLPFKNKSAERHCHQRNTSDACKHVHFFMFHCLHDAGGLLVIKPNPEITEATEAKAAASV